MSLSNGDIATAKGMLARGDRQQDIAAWFGCNSGRIAEINTGQRGEDVVPQSGDMPPSGPYLTSVRETYAIRAELQLLSDTFRRLHHRTDELLKGLIDE